MTPRHPTRPFPLWALLLVILGAALCVALMVETGLKHHRPTWQEFLGDGR